MLFDCDQIPDDLLAATRAHSRSGSIGPEGLDLAFLLDGLEAEREQGITIDVSYRSFKVRGRVCQIADCPGHAQYTRNMVTAASNCEAAIVLVDARRGMLEQTQRHMRICAMLGITAVAVTINKMDLCDWSEDAFGVICETVKRFSAGLGFENVTFIPVSALTGGNVASRGSQSCWYQGETLLEWLEQVNCIQSSSNATRLPIQSVGRPDHDKRVYFGTLLGGCVEKGQSLIVGQSGVKAKVSQIYDAGVLVEHAQTGAAIGITLDRHIDLTRGDVLCDDPATTVYSAQLVADLIWFSQTPMVPGRTYLFKGAGAWTQGTVSRLKHKIAMETGAEIAANVLEMNEIGCVNIATAAPMLCDPYTENRSTGGFLIVDTQTNETLGAGLIKHALRRSAFITPESAAIDSNSRAKRYNHKPMVVWLTGLSGSGKSTIAKLSEQNLWARHFATTLLDGDNLRSSLNQDLGFTEFDRVENVRRTAEVAKLMADAGMVVFCALISPFARDRDMARKIIGTNRFVEVFINTSVDVCAQRDPKGLYAKAYAGLIPNFTGVSSPYEEPAAPDITIATTSLSPAQAAAIISQYIVDATRLEDASRQGD
jgi:bifunctional enzyme CysN/CysC